MSEGTIYAGERKIKSSRKGYKVGLYFTLVIILLIVLWSVISQARWMLFESGTGARYHFDIYMLFGVIFVAISLGIAFFTFGQFSKGLSYECNIAGGIFHMEERQVIMVWAIIIGFVLGMGFWDIVTMINLALEYGILNIWSIPVTVYDFGSWQMIIPVWGLVIIGVVKMGAVLILYFFAIKNIRTGTVCEMAEFKKGAFTL